MHSLEILRRDNTHPHTFICYEIIFSEASNIRITGGNFGILTCKVTQLVRGCIEEIETNVLLLARVPVDLNVCTAQSHPTHFTMPKTHLTLQSANHTSESPLSPKLWIGFLELDQIIRTLSFSGSMGQLGQTGVELNSTNTSRLFFLVQHFRY